MSTNAIRINGRGNAWPVLLGQSHPMYSPNIAEDKKYHDQEILDDCQLQKWLNSQEYKLDLPTKFQTAIPNEIFLL
jgi:hypothetical protein